MLRGIDPSQYIDQLKIVIRNHQELSITDFVLTEFTLKRNGSQDVLPSDSRISECLRNQDTIEVVMHKDFEATHTTAPVHLPQHIHTQKLQAIAAKDIPPSPRRDPLRIINDPPRTSPDIDVESGEEDIAGPAEEDSDGEEDNDGLEAPSKLLVC